VGRPLLPEILGQLAPVGAKSPIFNRYSPVARRLTYVCFCCVFSLGCCEFGLSVYRCNRLPGETRFRSDLLSVERDVELCSLVHVSDALDDSREILVTDVIGLRSSHVLIRKE